MFNISANGIVTVNAGDDFELPIFINSGDDWEPLRYSLRPFDLLYFVIAEHNQPFDKAVVRKVFTHDDIDKDGNVKIRISHKDTENLLPGTYGYEVKTVIHNDNET